MSKTRFSPLSSLVQVIHQEDRQFVILTYTPDSTDLFHPSLHGTVATPNKSKDILFIEVGIVPNDKHGKNTNLWWFGVWTQQDLEAFFVGDLRPLIKAVDDVYFQPPCSSSMLPPSSLSTNGKRSVANIPYRL